MAIIQRKYETFANLGLVEGSIGVELGAGEVVDTGTIASTNTAGADIAVQFEFSRYGTTYANHSTLVLNPGAVLGGTIGGFDTAATILLNGFTATSDSFAAGDLVLQSGAASRTLAFAGSFVTPSFIVTTVATGTEITLEPAVCYLRGTRLTPAGEVPVECLHIGDAVITRFGGYRPVKWIGRQSFARRFIRHNREQWPVRIAAGALGAGLPRRDLFVSPGHSMFIGGALILAAALINGVTITQDDAPDEIHYHQIELETHDCVLA